MKKLAYSTFVAALVGAAAFSLADAQGQGQEGGSRRGGPGFGPGRGPMAIAKLADLTDAQRAQVREILNAARDDRQGPPASIALHRQLESELLADVPDDQKIETLRQQLAQAHADELGKRIEVQKQISAILTPEQRAKAREALANAPERSGRRDLGGHAHSAPR